MIPSLRNLITLTLTVLLLTACGSGHRITYSGHEESTEGVPGYVNGKKVSPNIKLGQSYSVDGDTYVPHYEPDYVEEGMASWYGPGFHGGKTANGEVFDKHDMTAAHRTLPLPSIVKVTLLSTGKSAYVRVNDRGPYARSRIIDLSYGAAKEIGMIAKGTGKVRVEYQLAESQRFADLLAQGRTPESINLEEEVLQYANSKPSAQVQYASNAPIRDDQQKTTLLDRLNPIASANAKEVDSGNANERNSGNDRDNADDPMVIESKDIGAPAITSAQPVYNIQPPTARTNPSSSQHSPAVQAMALAPPPVVPANAQSPPASKANPLYIQLGSFSQRENALGVQKKVASVGAVLIVPKPVGAQLFYRVRMGPYDAAQANIKIAQLRALGLTNVSLVKQ